MGKLKKLVFSPCNCQIWWTPISPGSRTPYNLNYRMKMNFVYGRIEMCRKMGLSWKCRDDRRQLRVSFIVRTRSIVTEVNKTKQTDTSIRRQTEKSYRFNLTSYSTLSKIKSNESWPTRDHEINSKTQTNCFNYLSYLPNNAGVERPKTQAKRNKKNSFQYSRSALSSGLIHHGAKVSETFIACRSWFRLVHGSSNHCA